MYRTLLRLGLKNPLVWASLLLAVVYMLTPLFMPTPSATLGGWQAPATYEFALTSLQTATGTRSYEKAPQWMKDVHASQISLLDSALGHYESGKIDQYYASIHDYEELNIDLIYGGRLQRGLSSAQCVSTITQALAELGGEARVLTSTAEYPGFLYASSMYGMHNRLGIPFVVTYLPLLVGTIYLVHIRRDGLRARQSPLGRRRLRPSSPVRPSPFSSPPLPGLSRSRRPQSSTARAAPCIPLSTCRMGRSSRPRRDASCLAWQR